MSENLKNESKVFKIILLISTAFVLARGFTYKVPVRDVPGCFPDYRPGFKCFVFEKLP